MGIGVCHTTQNMNYSPCMHLLRINSYSLYRSVEMKDYHLHQLGSNYFTTVATAMYFMHTIKWQTRIKTTKLPMDFLTLTNTIVSIVASHQPSLLVKLIESSYGVYAANVIPLQTAERPASLKLCLDCYSLLAWWQYDCQCGMRHCI